jgi:hypothetical protein
MLSIDVEVVVERLGVDDEAMIVGEVVLVTRGDLCEIEADTTGLGVELLFDTGTDVFAEVGLVELEPFFPFSGVPDNRLDAIRALALGDGAIAFPPFLSKVARRSAMVCLEG